MLFFRYPFVFVFYGFFFLILFFHGMTRKKRQKELESWGEPRVKSRLFSYFHPSAVKWKQRMRLGAVILLIFSAAGPQIGTKLKEVERKGVDILLLWDISESMLAEDVKPNRLQKAKYEISRLISNLKGDRVGIILFAGTSYGYLPFTGDYDAAHLFVDAVETDMIQVQGTSLGEAVERGLTFFSQEKSEKDIAKKYKVMVLVTDGEDHEGKVLEAIQMAVQEGIVVHTIGVGTSTGSLIPVYDERGNRIDYKKDPQGKLITTRLNELMLQELAQQGKGIYIRFGNRAGEMDDLLKALDQMEKRTLKTHTVAQFEDRYQIFLSVVIFLLVSELLISNRIRSKRVWRGRFV